MIEATGTDCSEITLEGPIEIDEVGEVWVLKLVLDVADDDAPMIASTICDPVWPTLSVSPRGAPLCVDDATMYSTELAIQDGTCCVSMEVYPLDGV